MSPMWPNNNQTRGTAGFSLVELLVAVAITVTMLAAILSVFFAVLQTVTRGHNTQKGFELARATMNIIEEDVTDAFGSRDLGDADKFFGAPMGMMFIVKNDEAAEGQPNKFSRVTYVVYLPSAQQVEIERAEVDPNTGEMLGSGEFITVTTYSLLRYVEPGITDLDSYAVDWVNLAGSTETTVGAELSATLDGVSYAAAFGAARNPSAGGQIPLSYNVSDDDLTAVRAKKRELWVRMLAGDPNLPDGWAILDAQAHARLASQGTPVSGTLVDWRDYVVAENVAYQPPPTGIQAPVVDPTNPLSLEPTFFTYGIVLPYRVFSAMNNLSGFSPDDIRRAPKPIYVSVPYWNSTYNANPNLLSYMISRAFLVQQFNDHGFPVSEVGMDRLIIDLATNIQPGSPFKRAMPELIGIRMGYQLESPFAGVPEFQEVFGQVIDLPSAYSRKPMGEVES